MTEISEGPVDSCLREWLPRFISTVGLPLAVCDIRTGEILTANEAFASALDIPIDTVEGANLSEIGGKVFSATLTDVRSTYESAQVELAHSASSSENSGNKPVVRIDPLADASFLAVVSVENELTTSPHTGIESMQLLEHLIGVSDDAVLVADESSDAILTVNAAAEEFFNASRDDLIGTATSSVYTETDQSLEPVLDIDGIASNLDHESQRLTLIETDGRHRPVRAIESTIPLGNSTIRIESFRDISSELLLDRTVDEFATVVAGFERADDPSEVIDELVETIASLIDLSYVAFYRFDEDDGTFYPVSVRDECGDIGTFDELSLATGPVWTAFLDGESVRLSNDECLSVPDTDSISNQIVVPMRNYGLILAGDHRSERFSARTRHVLETIVTTAVIAIDKITWYRDAKDLDRELQQHREHARTLERLVEWCRECSKTIQAATTRSALEATLCEKIVELDAVEFAWFGRIDHVNGKIVPQAVAGSCEGYVETINLELDRATEPTACAVADRTVVTASRLGIDVLNEPWRSEALKRSVETVLSVPLEFDGVVYGVLSVYFGDGIESDEPLYLAMLDLATKAGFAIMATARTDSLLSNQLTEIEFEIGDPDCFFSRASKELDTRLELDGFVPKDGMTTLGFVRLRNGEADSLQEFAEQSSIITGTRVIEYSEHPLVQLRFTDDFLPLQLVKHGVVVQSFKASQGSCQLTIGIPPSMDIDTAIEAVEATFSGTIPVAKRELSVPLGEDRHFTDMIFDGLTARQREVLELAYDRGYFETPKGISGPELADELDISTSAVHDHLRRAQRAIFDKLFHQDNITIDK